MSKDELKKVCGYIRVSSPGQAKDGESLNTQKDNIRHFAEGKGWELTRIYEDAGISGAKAENRPSFMEMMKDAEQKKFNGIVFSRFSRFARNASDFLLYVDKLKSVGVSIFSIKEGIDPTTKTGELMMGFMALIAAWERELIREQMLENKMVKWRDCRMFNGRPTYGYYWDKEKKRLLVNEDEAKIYKRIVDMYLNRGMSFKSIAIELKDEGVLCKKAPFSSVVISGILKHPAYYGRYVVNRHKYISDPLKGRSKRTKEEKPEDELIVYDAPPLITKTDWDRLQKKTAFNTIRSKRVSAQDPYWLRDVLVCGECGGVVKPHNGAKRKDGTRPRYYGCYWAEVGPKDLKLNKKEKCTLPLIKADEVEASVWGDFMRPLATNRDQLEFLIDPAQYQREIRELDNKKAKAEQAAKKKSDSRERLFVLYEEGELDKNELTRRMKRIDEEKREIDDKLVETERRREELIHSQKDNALLRELVGNKRGVLKKLLVDLNRLSRADKKRLIESWIDGKIRVEIEYDDTGATRWFQDYAVRFNKSILQTLQAEGKIQSLDKPLGKSSSLGPSPDEL